MRWSIYHCQFNEGICMKSKISNLNLLPGGMLTLVMFFSLSLLASAKEKNDLKSIGNPDALQGGSIYLNLGVEPRGKIVCAGGVAVPG